MPTVFPGEITSSVRNVLTLRVCYASFTITNKTKYDIVHKCLSADYSGQAVLGEGLRPLAC